MGVSIISAGRDAAKKAEKEVKEEAEKDISEKNLKSAMKSSNIVLTSMKWSFLVLGIWVAFNLILYFTPRDGNKPFMAFLHFFVTYVSYYLMCGLIGFLWNTEKNGASHSKFELA